MTKRREFLKASAVTTGGLLVPWKWSKANGTSASPPLDPSTIPKFVDPLTIPEVLKPTGHSKNAASYEVTMTEFQQQRSCRKTLKSPFLPTTTVWGYEGSFPGPTIEARRNKPVAVKWINELPNTHFLPIDTTLHSSPPVTVGKVVNGSPMGPQVAVAHAERADIVVDFSSFDPGDVITMKNLGINDFPSGDSVKLIMQFRVIESSGTDTSELPATLRSVPWPDPADVVKTRNLTLDKITDHYGRPKFLLNKAKWMDPITEDPKLNTTEIWNFINTTPNGHPMHVHLVTFQVLSRRKFDLEKYNLTGEIEFLPGPNMLPPNENGMRDMVRVPAGTVVQIIAHFDIPGTFVWHCHFLDHEDHEMMRPFNVVP